MQKQLPAMRPSRVMGVRLGADRSHDRERAESTHVLAVCWIILMLGAAKLAPLAYTASMQEDRFVEWWTVGLFAAAGLVRMRESLRKRQLFDFLVGAFCIFVAGEEFSWGQRLLGLTPPAYFIEHNTAQEISLHNVDGVFVQAEGILMLALLGYGVMMPLIARMENVARVLRGVGATAPGMETLPAFTVAVVLILTNPVEYTWEWVETLAGGLFLITARPKPRVMFVSVVGSLAIAAGMTVLSARGMAENSAAFDCASRQARALLEDVTQGTAGTPKLLQHSGSLNERVRHAMDEGYLRAGQLHSFDAAGCPQTPMHVIDPWGIPYWISAGPPTNGERQITIISLGPNRRRDITKTPAGSDDVAVSRMVPVPPAR